MGQQRGDDTMYINTLIGLEENMPTYGINGKKVNGHVSITTPGIIKCYVQNLNLKGEKALELYAFSSKDDRGVRIGELISPTESKETRWRVDEQDIMNSGLKIKDIDAVAVVKEGDSMRNTDTVLIGFARNKYTINAILQELLPTETQRPTAPTQGPTAPIKQLITPIQGITGTQAPITPKKGLITPIQGPIGITGPTQGTMGSTQGMMGSMQGMMGSTQGMMGPTQGMTGSTQGMMGPTQGMTGSTQGMMGPTHGMMGPTQGMMGPTQGMMTPMQELMAQLQELIAQMQGPMAPTQSLMKKIQEIMAQMQGTMKPTQGTMAPTQGSMTSRKGSMKPTQGVMAPTQEYMAPTQGVMAPTQEYMAPTQGVMAPTQEYMAPTQGNMIQMQKLVLQMQELMLQMQVDIVPTQEIIEIEEIYELEEPQEDEKTFKCQIEKVLKDAYLRQKNAANSSGMQENNTDSSQRNVKQEDSQLENQLLQGETPEEINYLEEIEKKLKDIQARLKVSDVLERNTNDFNTSRLSNQSDRQEEIPKDKQMFL